jgi:hypothetical protein
MSDSLPPQTDLQSSAEPFGNVPNPSASFGTVPHRSESFRSVPHASAPFRTVPKPSERTADHTHTVREVAKMFEAAGVSRTERSIVKWCLPNKHDVARLDAVFDVNERKWFITQESVDRAIAEEQARAARHHELLASPPEEPVPNVSEQSPKRPRHLVSDDEDTTELRGKLRDLEITNRVKDAYIDQLKGNLQSADEERRGYIQQLIDKSHQIGSLETQLGQLSAPRNHSELPLPNHLEGDTSKTPEVSD